jgi:hypothetical protein
MGSPANLSTLMQYGGYLAIALLVIAGTYLLFFCIRLFLNRRYLKRRTVLWLELTPPAQLAKTPESTVQLFSVIHGLRSARTLKEKLLGRLPVLSLEISSTKRDGVRYLIQVERSIEDTIHKSIAAYIPEAKVKEVVYSPPPTHAMYMNLNKHITISCHSPPRRVLSSMIPCHTSPQL